MRYLMHVAVSVAFSIGGPSWADDLVTSARLSVAAWECSSIAALNDDLKISAKRLFDLGYNHAKTAALALASATNDRDSRKELPIVWLWTAGPNIEFTLGRIYQQVSDAALKPIYADESAVWPLMATIEFNKRNCELLR